MNLNQKNQGTDCLVKQMKKVFVILLAIGFISTMTDGAVSSGEDHDDHHGHHHH